MCNTNNKVNIEEAIELSIANGNLPIKIFNDFSYFDEELPCMEIKITKMNVSFYCIIEDKMYLDEDELIDELMYEDSYTEETAKKFADDNGKMIIAVWTRVA